MGNGTRLGVAVLAALLVVGCGGAASDSGGAESRSTALKGGVAGATLAGYKTVDICAVDETTWRYSGVISVWNESVIDTVGFALSDFIEYKTGTKFIKAFDVPVTFSGEIPAGTTQETALTFPYSVDAAPLAGTIRNNASLTILNHSNYIGTPFGPNPKATYTGAIPPPACAQDKGCTLTQGYWGTYGSEEQPHAWPAGYARDACFWGWNAVNLTCDGQTWQEVLDAAGGGNGFYILARQYIAAVLNQANGAFVPSGVQDTMNLAAAWFAVPNTPVSCSARGSCGIQKDWGVTLDLYNNGLYPDGPQHCE